MSKKIKTNDNPESERGDATSAAAAATIDGDITSSDAGSWFDVLPSNRIHAQLQRDEGVGRLSKQASSFIGACSAVFLKELCQSAIDASITVDKDDDTKTDKNRSNTTTASSRRITLDHVRAAASKYPFLDGVLEDVTEDTAPRIRLQQSSATSSSTKNQPVKKKAKLDPVVQQAKRAVQSVGNSARAELASTGSYKTIEQDEDDYD